MVTSHTPNTQPMHGAQRLRGRVRGRLVSRFRSGGENRRPRVTPIGAILFVLVASTTLAIASVSFWWVPVYLVLLVLIFLTPPRWQPSSSASVSDAESDTVEIAGLAPGLRVDTADGPDEIRSVSQFDSDSANVDVTVALDSNPDVITGGAAKRRGRVRARKVTNPASGPVKNSLPVAWIQVGPGKFVRAEGGIQTADIAQTEEIDARVLPATVPPAETTSAAPAQTEPPAELNSFTSPGASPPGEVGPISVSNDGVSGPVIEEHGIAPSAFNLTPLFESSVEASDQDLPGQVDQPEVTTAGPAEPGTSSLPGSADLRIPLCQPGVARKWVRRIQRGIVRTGPRVNRVSGRGITPNSPNPRLPFGSSCALNVARHDAASRAFGRVLHVQRIIRTRSPPRC
jgi:hypothetical protein